MTLTVNGKPVELLSVRINNARNWFDPAEPETFTPVAMFDTDGEAAVSVSYPYAVSDVTVRPSRFGIKPTIKGNTVSFKIPGPGQYSVELNGSAEKDALIIFADPPAAEIPEGARVINGRHEGDIRVGDGETVYLAPGSAVYGQIDMGSNSRLMGRGIISGSHLKSGSGAKAVNAVRIWNAENVSVEDVACFDQNRWVLEIRNSSNIKLNNVKIMSSRNNGDGITIQSAENISVTNCFVRSWDDSIVIKNYGPANSRNITVCDCVIWTDLAQSLEIGFETNAGYTEGYNACGGTNHDPRIHGIAFENIDILHNFHKAPISIHNCDACKVYDVKFKNVFIDDAQMGRPGINGEGWKYLIDFTNSDSESIGGDKGWTHTDGDRELSDITVEGVYVLGGCRDSCGARFVNANCGGESAIKNVLLKDIYFIGEPIVFNNLIEGIRQETEI